MSFTQALTQSGFKKEKSTEGEFTPLEGFYKVQFVVAEQEVSKKTQEQQLRVEFKITETIQGSESNSKFNEFRRWLALEGEDVASNKKGIPFIINALFTAGVDVDTSNDAALIAAIEGALGTEMFVKAWGWTPEDGNRAFQSFVFMKEEIALKKAKAQEVPI